MILIFYLFLVRRDKSFLPKLNFITLSLTIFVSVYALSVLFSTEIQRSIWGNYSRGSIGLLNLLYFFVLFLVASGVFKSKSDWDLLLKFSLLVGVFTALVAEVFYGYFRQFSDSKRIFGTLGNPALLAGYLLIHSFLSLWFFEEAFNKKKKIFYALLFLFLSLSVILTAVRGAVLGLAVGFIIFLFLYIKKYYQPKYLAAVFLVLLLIFVGFFTVRNIEFLRSNFILGRLSDISFSQGSTISNRLEVWKMAINGFKDMPLLGWGPENFVLVYYKNFNPSLFINSFKENVFDRAHNVFLEILATTGIFGLTAYLLVWFSIFYATMKKDLFFFTPLFAGLFIHNLFIFDSLSSLLLFFLVTAFISRNEDLNFSWLTRKSFLFPVFIIFLLLIFILQFGFGNPALEQLKVKRFASATLDKTVIAEELDEELKMEILSSLDKVSKILAKDPDNLIWYIFSSALNNQAGKLIDKEFYTKSEEVIKKAQSQFPGHQQIYYQLAIAKAGQGNFEEAVKISDLAISLNPKSDESYWQKAMLYIDFGNFNTGYKLIMEAEKDYPWILSFTDTMKMIDIEIRRENYKRVAYLYEHYAIRRFRPKNAQLHASLAATYAKIGEKEKAIEYAQKAAELDPAYADDSEIFIKSLR